MEAYSVEDQGKGICFCTYCYNVQPGVAIDYATGDSHLNGKITRIPIIVLQRNTHPRSIF